MTISISDVDAWLNRVVGWRNTPRRIDRSALDRGRRLGV
jgi:hypothetical protein